MATKILINTTPGILELLDLGISIPAVSQITIPPESYTDAASSDELVELIGNGSVIVNDGNEDLSKAQGMALIQSGFVKTDFADDLVTSMDRLKVDVSGMLSQGDGSVLVSDNDTAPDFLDGKIEPGSSKVIKTITNPGADETLVIDIDPSQIDTADLNNDAGFITSGEAPVQPGDIANFETSTQLDARDVANRDRANHTGTQTASTISDFNAAASAAAPVQPGDLADFETSTQLDSRDAANRDRSNHTGTQLASTISDFVSAVQAAETVTSLSLASNILTFTDESGTPTNIDLSIYLDDTNLARIVNGTLDPGTGIITFERDDLTTFTIDASALLDNQDASEVPVTPSGNLTATDVQQALEDQQGEIDTNEAAISSLANLTSIIDSGLQNQIDSNDTDILNLQNSQATQDAAIALNTAKVSADGSIDTHSDVDVTTTAPQAGDVLAWDGSNFVPDSTDNGFTVFSIWAEENGSLTAGSRQWSFGNGATGNINIILPIEAELFAVSFDAESGTGTSSIQVLKNDDLGSPAFVTKEFTNKDFELLGTPVAFVAGDCIGFRTLTDNGSLSDVRVAAWFRIRTSMLSGSVLNDLLDVTVTSPSAGQGLVYNGSAFVNQDIVTQSEISTVGLTGDYNDLSNRPLLGTAADNDETDFATAAQGALADSALQSGDNVSELTNDAGYITATQAPVQSVAGKTGTVTLNNTDVGLSNVPNIDATDADNVVVDPIAGVTGTNVQTVLESLNSNAVTDHGALTGLLDDDHPQYLNEGRHDSLPQDNPHSVTFTQAVTADSNTDISAAEAETLTDGSNADALHEHTSAGISDFNTAVSAAAPVQPGDIANFETTTQLNARDVANRDRNNHTGTQTASTISDFATEAAAAAPVQLSDLSDFETTAQLNSRDNANRDRANHTGTQLANTISNFTTSVKLAETTTSLTILGNVLTYIDEDGDATNIDLSIYLDDTNLARLVSGSIDSNGIVTFTRDDSSTFTVDFSSLNDQAAIAQAIIDHEALADPHPQYTTAAEASAAAPVQPGDIANFETSTQLDARDLANRSRSNHTGTQLSSTISDFNTAASAAAPIQPADIANFETSVQLDLRDSNNRDRANHTGTQTASTISDFNAAASAAAPVQSVNGQAGTVSLSQTNLADTVIASPQTGQIIQYNGSQWVNATLNTDVIVTQNGHGFSITNNVPLPAYVDPFGTVQLAIADNLTTLSAFYITEIVDANSFKIQNNGIIVANSHGLNVGEYYFVSDTTAGSVTNTEPTVTINDVVFYVLDTNRLILLDNRPEDKNSIEKFIIKTRNTNITTNINTGTNTEVPLTGTASLNEANFYTVVGNGIQVPQTRTYVLKASIHVQGTATRANQRIRFAINGTPTGDIAASGYIRNSSGHNESSYKLDDVFVLNANDIVTVVSTPEAGGGTITLAVIGSSSLTVEAR